MKAPFVLAVSIAALVVSSTLYFATAGGDPSATPLAAESFDSAKMKAVENRLDALDRRIADLDTLQSEVQTLGDESPLRTTPTAVVGTRPATSRRGKRDAKNSRPLLDRILADRDAREQFSTFIDGAIEKARSQRRSGDQRRAKERRTEREELSKGPYGSRNYKVNSLAKKLDLNQRQKDFYNDLLVKYDEQRRDLFGSLRNRYTASSGKATGSSTKQGGNSSQEDRRKLFVGGPEAIRAEFQAVTEEMKGLSTAFDAEFSPALDPQQRETYEQLPEHERGGTPGREWVTTATNDGSFGAGVMILHGIAEAVTAEGEFGGVQRVLTVNVDGDRTEVIELEIKASTDGAVNTLPAPTEEGHR